MSVYPVREDTLLVKENLEKQSLEGIDFLEVGVGNAEISLTAAERGAEVTAVDINPEAVERARQRFEQEEFKAEVFKSDLFEQVDREFEFIVFNPPYLKGEEGIGDEEMWRGGETGLEVAERFLSEVSGYLSEEGKAWIVLSSQTDYEKLVENSDLVEVEREKLWFETVFLFRFE
jgi:release factor glutamine methyltransferase